MFYSSYELKKILKIVTVVYCAESEQIRNLNQQAILKKY